MLEDLWCLKKDVLIQLLINSRLVNDGVKTEIVDKGMGYSGTEYKYLLLRSVLSTKLFYRIHARYKKGEYHNVGINVVLLDVNNADVDKEVCIYYEDTVIEVAYPMIDELVHTLPKVIRDFSIGAARNDIKKVFGSNNNTYTDADIDIVNSSIDSSYFYTGTDKVELESLLKSGKPL